MLARAASWLLVSEYENAARSVGLICDYITGRGASDAIASIGLGGRARGVGVPGSRFEMPAGTGIRRSLAGSRGASWTTAGSGLPRHPGGVLIVSSQDWVGSSDPGGGEEMVSSEAGRRMGGVVARASMVALIAANSSLPVQSFTRASRSA
jgi:hypothetical protein